MLNYSHHGPSSLRYEMINMPLEWVLEYDRRHIGSESLENVIYCVKNCTSSSLTQVVD